MTKRYRGFYGYELKDSDEFFDLLTEKYSTISAFCRHADLSRTIIYRLMYGKRKASRSTVDKISDALSIQKEDIFLVNSLSKDSDKVKN